MLETLLDWDRETLIYLNNLGSEPYDQFWLTITDFSTWVPFFLFLIIFVFLKYPKKDALAMLLTVAVLALVVSLLTDFAKESFERLRPCNTPDLVNSIRAIIFPNNYSFWSGHASSSMTTTTLFVLFLRHRFKWSWLFYSWPLLFTASRIYLGVHYPLDILTGALVGIGFAVLFYTLFVSRLRPYLGLTHP